MPSAEAEVDMVLKFRPFGREHYAEYASWFDDAELNRRLGPMDEDWLAATLEDKSYETWAVFRAGAFVSVLEVTTELAEKLAVISGIAVKPELRRQGIATEGLRRQLEEYRKKGVRRYIAQVALENLAAKRCLERLNFVPVTGTPDEDGFLLLELEARG